MRVIIAVKLFAICAMSFSFSATGQQSTPLPESGKHWEPGNSSDRYGSAEAACKAMFDSLSANNNLVPNHYKFGRDYSGNVTSAVCAQYNSLGGFSGGTSANAFLICPAGTVKSGDDNQCSRPKDEGEDCAGNPISILNGEKIETATDFVVGRGRLSFVRNYRSLQSRYNSTALGAKWASNLHPSVHADFNAVRGSFTYQLLDGKLLRFQKEFGIWKQAGLPEGGTSGWVSISDKDRKDRKGYRIQEAANNSILITTPDNVVRTFVPTPPTPIFGNASMLITSIKYPDGYEITLNYGGSDVVQTATDTDGYTIQFTYNNRNLLETVTAPDGSVYGYEYSEFGNTSNAGISLIINSAWKNYSVLSKVIYPDNSVSDSSDNPSVTYHYADRNYASTNGSEIKQSSYLNGITDERGIKTKEWDYDYYGANSGTRAIASRGANGVEETLIEEVIDRREYKLTNAKGKEAIYKYVDQAKTLRLDRIEGQATSNCAASSKIRDYDAAGYQSISVDSEGQRQELTYDPVLGLPTQIKHGAGTAQQETTNIVWDTITRKPASIDRPGLRADFTYDADQNLTEQILTDTTSHSVPSSSTPKVRVTKFTWGNDGLLLTVDGPKNGASDTTTFTYDGFGNLASVTDELSLVTTINAVDGMGRPTSMTDPNGLVITFSYSPRGWVEQISLIGDGTTRTTNFTYDLAGNIIRTDLPNGGVFTYTYDDASWLTSVTTNTGDQVSYTHDLLGNVTRTDYAPAGGSSGAYITMQYDDLGRIIGLLGGGGDTQSFSYDRADRQTALTDGLGRTWLTGFDALNRVISTSDPEGHAIQQDWGTTGAPNSFTDARNLQTTYIRNGFGEALQVISPDTGITNFWYDENGQVTRRTDAAGHDVNFSYDASGQLISETYPNQPALNRTYVYNQANPVHPGFRGRLSRIITNWGGQNFRYNQFGELVRQIQGIDGIPYHTFFSYYAGGDMQRLTYPSGRQVLHSRDALGRISGLQTRANGSGSYSPVISNITRASFGPITGYALPGNQATSFGYDQSYRVTDLQVTAGSSTLLHKRYTEYDPSGRIMEISNELNSDYDTSYAYHPDGRLWHVGSDLGETYWEYDPVGNRTKETGSVNGAPVYTKTYAYESTSNRLVSVTDSRNQSTPRSISYSGDGNIALDVDTQGAMTGYSYDQSGRLETLYEGLNIQASYKYDAFQHRVWRSSPTEGVRHFVFAPSGLLLGEYDGATGDVIAEYIWLEDRLVASVDGAGVISYVHTGHLGQPLLKTAATGAVIWRGEVSPFGTSITITGNGADPDLRLPGQWAEEGSGLYQNWHRDYDPSLGRYIEADPLGTGAGQSLYGYVSGDPINSIDPAGLQEEGEGWNPDTVADELPRLISPLFRGADITAPFLTKETTVWGFCMDLISTGDLTQIGIKRVARANRHWNRMGKSPTIGEDGFSPYALDIPQSGMTDQRFNHHSQGRGPVVRPQLRGRTTVD